MKFVVAALFLSLVACQQPTVWYAVNFGEIGEMTDSNGINYEKDPTDYFKNGTTVNVAGVTDNDLLLYHSYISDWSRLTVNFPDLPNGKYVLVVKTLTSTTNRSMEIILNNELSIPMAIGATTSVTGFDEHFYFTICNNSQLKYKDYILHLYEPTVNFEIVDSQQQMNVTMCALVILSGDAMFPHLSEEAEMSKKYQDTDVNCDREWKAPSVEVEIPETTFNASNQFNATNSTDNVVAIFNFVFSNLTFNNLNIFVGKSGCNSNNCSTFP